MNDDLTGMEVAEAEAQAPRGAIARTGQANYRTDISARGHSFIADEPAALGGGDAGPTPFDLLCAALGSCISITVRMYADRKGWPLEEVTAHVEHQRRGSGADAQDAMEVRITLTGPLTTEQHARLTDIATRCPMHRALTKGLTIGLRG